MDRLVQSCGSRARRPSDHRAAGFDGRIGSAGLNRLGLIADDLGYVYEVLSGNLVLASRSASGELPDIRNTRITVSADGSVAVVGSSATNLVPGDNNNASRPDPYSVEAGFDLFVVPIETLRFDDIADSIFIDDVTWLAGEGIKRGCNPSGTRFCPIDYVTRAQMAAFLSRALALPVPLEADRFVDDTGIFEADIEAIATAGITRGCDPEGTRFGPDDPVNREQMAAFLHRAFRSDCQPNVVTGKPTNAAIHGSTSGPTSGKLRQHPTMPPRSGRDRRLCASMPSDAEQTTTPMSRADPGRQPSRVS